ncbi:MAG: DNA internalization-related competence protein ComEC/Rec2 [Pseudoalteromonas sp.]|uniref:DNA internalization-related competence protein ComEC/Rec2 n=4 Tax=Pseudoalteromonas TaxID=53246 RepID=UPI003F97AAA8
MDKKQPYQLTVKIEKIINQQQNYYLQAKILSINQSYYSSLTAPSALLSINTHNPLLVNDQLQLAAHLKPYRSNKNIAVFDKERFAFSKRIFFKGKQVGELIHHQPAMQSPIRSAYQKRVFELYKQSEFNWLYYALLTGDKRLMSFEKKQQLQHLGLSHLLAISGLHIGLIFAIGFYCSRFIHTYIVLKYLTEQARQDYNLRTIYSLSGFVLAFIYVYLSDFLVSATRALIMLGCFIVLYFSTKQGLRWRSLLYALVAVLFLDPFSLLNPGLYFSFTAVVIIFLVFINKGTQTKSRITKFSQNLKMLLIIQLALFIGLLPLSLYFFNGVSLIGVVINILAIPLLSFVIMPMLLAFTLLGFLFDINHLVALLDLLLKFAFLGLAKIPVDIQWLDYGRFLKAELLFCYITLAVLYFSPVKRLCLIPLLIYSLEHFIKPSANWCLDVFDVGHGLMVLISKDNQGLLYDTGPIYFDRYSKIQGVLLSYTKKQGITIKHSIISHLDKDHAGGVSHLKAAGFNATFNQFHPNGIDQGCKAGSYQFNGLAVRLLPVDAKFTSNNDRSCVVAISDGHFNVLLTGDISEKREQSLIKKGLLTPSTILVSPHHGSNTSSSELFIQSVKPKVVIHSSRYKGQWNLPNEHVIARYKQNSVQQYNTALTGQVQVVFYHDDYQVNTARALESYWFLKD